MEPLTPGQLQVVRFIGKCVERNGVAPSLDEIAAHLGVIKATVQQYLHALEKKGVIKRRRYGHRAIEIIDERFAGSARGIALMGRIAAGKPIEAIEQGETLDLGELLRLRGEGERFMLQVKGDSMIGDGILDGDYVVVERGPSAEDGQTVVALMPDGSATLKRFYREKGRVRLQPANPTMKPIYVKEVNIQGVVRGVIRPMR